MTSFRIERLPFSLRGVAYWSAKERQHRDWPVVYTLNNKSAVYVGESVNAGSRLRQHLDSGKRGGLSEARVVIDDSFNKSACLDLESYLIKLFAGEGKLHVLNGNAGVANGNYFDRDAYRQKFEQIFAALRADGLFTTSIDEIENSDLFKLSPFKSLTDEQTSAVISLMQHLLADLASDTTSRAVIQGEPGTGKTVVAIFLAKLLCDIRDWDGDETEERNTHLAPFFTAENVATLNGLELGLVIPQQSLRKSIQKVFAKTPGLTEAMVMSPFDVGKGDTVYDLLIVDETHRLNQRASQTSAQKNREFREINERLYGADDPSITQFDWIKSRSRHQLLLVDARQRIRPADLDLTMLTKLTTDAAVEGRMHSLTSQLRVGAGGDYVEYVRRVLSSDPPPPRSFQSYDIRMFDDVGDMVNAIRLKDGEIGLSRLLAGYAWEWVSRKDKQRADIVFDDLKLNWNSRVVDWVDSPKSVDEVGSIHTIQGYDLNYAGVIIGRDLAYDATNKKLVFDRQHYFDTKGVQNNPGQKLTENDLLELVSNIYAVLLTRGIRGTYVYVCDPALRRYLDRYLGGLGRSASTPLPGT